MADPIRRPRVVFDTNIWISALVFGGAPGDLLNLFIEDSLVLAYSEELLTELTRKVLGKFPLFSPTLGLLEESIRRDAVAVRLGGITISICRDPDDDRLLETAVLGGCEYLITGDKDLLVLGHYKGIRIVSPAEFLAEYASA